MAQGFSVEDTMTDDSYFYISEIKLSITLLYIISDTHKCDIIWTENSDVIDSFISEILKYEPSVIVSSTKTPRAVLLFTPTKHTIIVSNEVAKSSQKPQEPLNENEKLWLVFSSKTLSIIWKLHS